MVVRLVFAWLFALLNASQVPAYGMTVIKDAQVVVTRADTPVPSRWLPVKLPFNWDTSQGGMDGTAHIVMRFSVDDLNTPLGIYFSRLGNAYEARLNGTLLRKKGSGNNPYEDYSKQPQLLKVPDKLLRKENQLAITLYAQGGRRAGMSTPVIGPLEEVNALFEDAYRWRVSGFLALSIISAVLGAIALLLWLRQRDPLYVYYGVGEIFWAVLVSDTLAEHTLLPWPYWGIVVFSAYALAAALISKFSLIFVGRHTGLMKTFGDWHAWLTVPVVAASFMLRMPILVSVWLGITLLVCIGTAVFVVIEGMKSVDLEKRVLAVAVIATCIAGTRDMLYFRVFPGFGAIPWVRYAWVAFGITLAWTIAERMRKSTQTVAMMNQELARRLAEREDELAASYSVQAEAQRNQAIVEERQRLTRDMHDGLGSQLLGALHLSQNPSVGREVITAHLREALDHLKLTVDAMQDIDGDIASLLGALRYRLSERLDAADVRLAWSVDPLPAIESWTLQQSRDLQMILFEAFSNIVAHSGATNAHLKAAYRAQEHAIHIDLSDNGRGFGPSSQSEQGGQGLSNMQLRAVRLDAMLDVQSSPDGTHISLVLALPSSVRPVISQDCIT